MKGVIMLLALKDVLSRLTLSRSTFLRLVQNGHIPKPVRVGLRRVAWREEDIDQFIKTGIRTVEGGAK